mmetsp:Transcript_47221/g.88482  ORF Transcript_47221/g.88482 Transcript_47221/m.88482 type:complete len:238 (-) Transcript_47221:649-1362(-)
MVVSSPEIGGVFFMSLPFFCKYSVHAFVASSACLTALSTAAPAPVISLSDIFFSLSLNGSASSLRSLHAVSTFSTRTTNWAISSCAFASSSRRRLSSAALISSCFFFASSMSFIFFIIASRVVLPSVCMRCFWLPQASVSLANTSSSSFFTSSNSSGLHARILVIALRISRTARCSSFFFAISASFFFASSSCCFFKSSILFFWSSIRFLLASSSLFLFSSNFLLCSSCCLAFNSCS